MVTLYLIFEQVPNYFFNAAVLLYIPNSSWRKFKNDLTELDLSSFIFIFPRVYDIVSYCGSSSYSSDNYWCCASFHAFRVNLNILPSENLIQRLCQFSIGLIFSLSCNSMYKFIIKQMMSLSFLSLSGLLSSWCLFKHNDLHFVHF